MKYFAFLSIAFTSVLAQVIPPVYPPPDGTYYIYNVAYKRFFNNANFVISEGNPILGWPLFGSKFTNEQWLVETTDFTTGSHSVTIRCLMTVQQDPGAGGYAANVNGKIVHSIQSESWNLSPVPEAAEQFIIEDGTVAITLTDGTAEPPNWQAAQLSAEAINPDATNQRWIFVPVDQIDTFDAENGV